VTSVEQTGLLSFRAPLQPERFLWHRNDTLDLLYPLQAPRVRLVRPWRSGFVGRWGQMKSTPEPSEIFPEASSRSMSLPCDAVDGCFDRAARPADPRRSCIPRTKSACPECSKLVGKVQIPVSIRWLQFRHQGLDRPEVLLVLMRPG